MPKKIKKYLHKQTLPGSQQKMKPTPVIDNINYKPGGKLKGKIALITGGDSGIGKAVAILFAKEGAKISIIYLNEHEDAKKTKQIIESYGSEALLIAGDTEGSGYMSGQVLHPDRGTIVNG